MALSLLAAAPARPQSTDATRPRPLAATHAGAFQQRHPEASALLDSLWERRMEMLSRLVRDGDAPSSAVEAALGPGRPSDGAGSAGTELPHAMRSQLEWTRALRRQLYDAYADERIADRAGAAERVVDHYLGQAGIRLPATHKSLAILFSTDPAAHSGHRAATFVERHPAAVGRLWAQQWLELALSDPLIRFRTAEERRDGVRAVVSRYREMVRAAPHGLPAAMPTTPAIAPELSRSHPRAATVLDNVHMMQLAVLDVLVSEHVDDVAVAIERVIRRFQDPAELAVSEYEWMLMALRQGIYEQGGPAIGRLERSERNHTGGHGDHGGVVLPGMRGLAPARTVPEGHDHRRPRDR